MNNDVNKRNEEANNPRKVYNEEWHNEGSTVSDTNEESKARDKAKIDKALSGHGQKIDSIDESEWREMEENR